MSRPPNPIDGNIYPNSYVDVSDLWERMVGGGDPTPPQWWAERGSNPEYNGYRKLALAMLEGALRDYKRFRERPINRLYVDVVEWATDLSDSRPCNLNWVCDLLGIPAGPIAEHIRRRRPIEISLHRSPQMPLRVMEARRRVKG